MAAEKQFETKVKRYIDGRGGYVKKFFANAYTAKGIPDLICCINGYSVWVEIKAQNGTPSEMQVYQCNKIRAAGGFAFILYPSGFQAFQEVVMDLVHDDRKVTNRCLPLILK